MPTATVTVQVPDKVAQAVDGLELEADDAAIEPIIRWNIDLVRQELGEIAEADPLADAEEIRRLAQRLGALADASEGLH